MSFGLFVFVLGIAALICCIYIFVADTAESWLGVVMAVVAVVLMVAGGSIKTVKTGYTGVRISGGRVQPEPLKEGLTWVIPVFDNVEQVNNKQQDVIVEDEVWGETLEQTPVYATNVVVTYQIPKESSVWVYTNVKDYKTKLVDKNIINSAIKNAMVEFRASEVTIRKNIEPRCIQTLQLALDSKYGEGVVLVKNVVVFNMDFEQSYNDAIAQKSVARQQYEQQEFENAANIEKEQALAKQKEIAAEADASVKIKAAEADLKVAEIEAKLAVTKAQATADATVVKAQAQADANKLLSDSLTEDVLKDKLYDKWDGALPKYTSEAGSIISLTE